MIHWNIHILIFLLQMLIGHHLHHFVGRGINSEFLSLKNVIFFNLPPLFVNISCLFGENSTNMLIFWLQVLGFSNCWPLWYCNHFQEMRLIARRKSVMRNSCTTLSSESLSCLTESCTGPRHQTRGDWINFGTT